MMRPQSLWLLCLALLAAAQAASPAAASDLIAESVANSHGLTRAWFAQVEMDRARGRLTHLVLADGTLFAQTAAAMVHALDPETGQTLWAVQVGTPDYPNMPVDARGDYVAVANGSTLYILNRYDGKLLWQKRLEGGPAAGPGLSDRHVYIPLVSGMVYAYPLKPVTQPALKLEGEEEHKPTPPANAKPAQAASGGRSAPTGAAAAAASKPAAPPEEATANAAEAEAKRRSALRLSQGQIVGVTCPSIGQAFNRPLVTVQFTGQENITWTTDRGYLFTANLVEDHFISVYRLTTGGPMSTEATYLPPDENNLTKRGVIFGASQDGFVYAVQESNGNLLWRFSAADPITERTVVVGRQIYVPTEIEGMYCLNAENGGQLWWTKGIRRFLAASKERLYTMDAMGRIVLLHAQTGARLDSFDTAPQLRWLTNDMTDRLYVASPTGLVQCLHEVDLAEPLHHRELLREQRAQEAGEAPPADATPAPTPSHTAPAPTSSAPAATHAPAKAPKAPKPKKAKHAAP